MDANTTLKDDYLAGMWLHDSFSGLFLGGLQSKIVQSRDYIHPLGFGHFMTVQFATLSGYDEEKTSMRLLD